MKKILCFIITINLCLINISYGETAPYGQTNSEISYKEAMTQISRDNNEKIETAIINDKLSTKKYNFYFNTGKDIDLNYVQLESVKEHDEKNQLKATWKSILKVDNKRKLIVEDMYVKIIPAKELLNDYNFEMGSQGRDVRGEDIKGYYSNIYMSGIASYKNKQSHENYYITHFLYFSF